MKIVIIIHSHLFLPLINVGQDTMESNNMGFQVFEGWISLCCQRNEKCIIFTAQFYSPPTIVGCQTGNAALHGGWKASAGKVDFKSPYLSVKVPICSGSPWTCTGNSPAIGDQFWPSSMDPLSPTVSSYGPPPCPVLPPPCLHFTLPLPLLPLPSFYLLPYVGTSVMVGAGRYRPFTWHLLQCAITLCAVR